MLSGNAIQYREMAAGEIGRIAEVNRQESVHIEYVVERDASGLGLVAKAVKRSPPLEVAAWGKRGTEFRIDKWSPALERGGFLYGAFGQDRLVGFVILGPREKDGSGEIVALFVDKNHRRLGIATNLMAWVNEKARALEMKRLFVGSNPTESAVGIYLSHGFEIISLKLQGAVGGPPGDIGMAKSLAGA